VYWDYGTSGADWALVVSETSGSFTFDAVVTIGITAGSSYQFKYRARNQFGTGAFSTPHTITAAAVAAQLTSASTTLSGTNVIVSWPATTNDRGSTVTAYRIKFKTSGGAYTE